MVRRQVGLLTQSICDGIPAFSKPPVARLDADSSEAGAFFRRPALKAFPAGAYGQTCRHRCFHVLNTSSRMGSSTLQTQVGSPCSGGSLIIPFMIPLVR